MACLVQYDRETGAIQGVWTAGSRELLLPNIRDDDPAQGYVLCDEIDPAALQERYEVQGGLVVPRQEVTLVATPATFAADGETACLIAPVPFVPCTLLVQEGRRETPVALSRADDPLVLTAEEPATFTIRLQALPGSWAPSITVEAL